MVSLPVREVIARTGAARCCVRGFLPASSRTGRLWQLCASIVPARGCDEQWGTVTFPEKRALAIQPLRAAFYHVPPQPPPLGGPRHCCSSRGPHCQQRRVARPSGDSSSPGDFEALTAGWALGKPWSKGSSAPGGRGPRAAARGPRSPLP